MSKVPQLNSIEARVIGTLIEKSITTPDQYPMSVNALVNACNQKSNRSPVTDYNEEQVLNALADLQQARLVVTQTGSRTVKYAHRFCNSEFGSLKFNPQELAVICELMLRGAQTPGELHARVNRMTEFSNLAAIEVVIERLRTREDGPFLIKMIRAPGRRESSYGHLFTGTPVGSELRAEDADQIAQLEARWQSMDYAYLDDLGRCAEWSTIEALLQTPLEYDQVGQARLPQHPTSALKVLESAQKVRKILEHFVIAAKDSTVSHRVYCASAADLLEKMLEPTLGSSHAADAANRFLKHRVSHANR